MKLLGSLIRTFTLFEPLFFLPAEREIGKPRLSLNYRDMLIHYTHRQSTILYKYFASRSIGVARGGQGGILLGERREHVFRSYINFLCIEQHLVNNNHQDVQVEEEEE